MRRSAWGVCAVVLSCCGSFQQQSDQNVTLTGQSIGGGSDTRALSCSGTATLTITWQGSAGAMTVQLSRGGTSVHDATYTASGTEQTDTATFPAASYDLAVTRSSDWKGGYTVKLACP